MVDQEELMMREVDEEVRRDKFDLAWRKYRIYIIGSAVSIVLVVAANTFWKSHLKDKRDAASDIYTATLAKSGIEGADVSAVWSESRSELSEGYVDLSYLQEAAAMIKAGKLDEALAAYDTLAKNSSTDKRMRELAQLLASRIEYQQGKYAQARGRLITLTGDDALWNYSAQETLALIDIAEGNIKDAVSKLSVIANSPAAPQAIKARADELRQLLESQIVEGVTETAPETGAEAIEEAPVEKSDSDAQQESAE